MAAAVKHLIDVLRGAGLVLTPRGGNIHVTPADRLTDELRGLIRAHKPDLLAALAANDAALTPLDRARERIADAAVRYGLPVTELEDWWRGDLETIAAMTEAAFAALAADYAGRRDQYQGRAVPEDPDQGRRRAQVVAELRRRPEVDLAYAVQERSDRVIVALAIRDVGTCELAIDWKRWNRRAFDRLFERPWGTA